MGLIRNPFSKNNTEYRQSAADYVDKSLTCLNRGNYEQAIADSSTAIELAPDFAAAYYNRGIAYGNLGNPGKAVADFNMAIKLNPRNAFTYYICGLAYSKIGNYESMMEHIKIAADRGLKEARTLLTKLKNIQ